MDLAELIAPSHTAVIVSEMQRGLVGDLATGGLTELAAGVRDHGIADTLAKLLDGARRTKVSVVHATLQFRADRAGVKINTPLLAVMLRDPEHMLVGSDQAQIIPELGPAPTDVVHARIHGMSAFTGTELDAILRSRDVRTLVIGGVSLNEAVIGTAIEAVNLGYRVVIVRDGVLGMPKRFGDDMLTYAFSLLGKVTTSAAILDAWGVGQSRHPSDASTPAGAPKGTS
jgi:nicotinamidase-related amidase